MKIQADTDLISQLAGDLRTAARDIHIRLYDLDQELAALGLQGDFYDAFTQARITWSASMDDHAAQLDAIAKLLDNIVPIYTTTETTNTRRWD